jgi:hypothetical protein
MVLAQEAVIQINPVSDIIKATILSAFTFLSALSVRDVIIKTLEALVPDNTKEKLVFVYFYCSIVILVTILLAFLWQNSASK